jgi:hypothetical protein
MMISHLRALATLFAASIRVYLTSVHKLALTTAEKRGN